MELNPLGYLVCCQDRVNNTLNKLLPLAKNQKAPVSLQEAMRYACLNGGKRIRAAFVYATGEALGAKPTVLHDIAAAVEMIHAFSLIHDDLPALDNDDLRRGKPTCHKVYGEATAILAGDALQARAFEVIGNLPQKEIPAKSIVQMTLLLARAIGVQGLIGGEELDISMTDKKISVLELEHMYYMKTGYLLHACIILGALAAQCNNPYVLENLSKFSHCIGLLFQIHDDIIGLESSTEVLGKTQGKDLMLKKNTYPQLVGKSKAQAKEQELHKKAIDYLNKSGIDVSNLNTLTDYIINRNT